MGVNGIKTTVNTTIGYYYINDENKFNSYLKNKIATTDDVIHLESINVLEKINSTLLIS